MEPDNNLFSMHGLLNNKNINNLTKGSCTTVVNNYWELV